MDMHFRDKQRYDQVRQNLPLEKWKQTHGALRANLRCIEAKGILRVTKFGETFIGACVRSRLPW